MVWDNAKDLHIVGTSKKFCLRCLTPHALDDHCANCPPAQSSNHLDSPRPDWSSYFLSIADKVAERSTCSRRQVGAVLAQHHQIISTGYNGTPFGATHCDQGGCPRCASDAEPWTKYDGCLCVHAERNAVLLAARYGTGTEGATLYTQIRPCLNCLMELIQAGVTKVVYHTELDYPEEVEKEYKRLAKQGGVVLLWRAIKP